jgi:hypothetical protein
MKIHRLSLVILVVLTCPWPAVSQSFLFPEEERRVISVYNGKKDMTIVQFGPMHLWNFSQSGGDTYDLVDGELGLAGYFTYRGKVFVRPESISLIFHSINVPSNRWELTKQKDLEITADDDHWSTSNIQVSSFRSSVSGDFFVDSLSVSMPCEAFARIAKAKKLKLRLGDRGMITLRKHHAATLRDLAGRTGC